MEVIKADQLKKSFGIVSAVNRLSLSVSEGEIFGLVGPDGAGKTTTIRMLTSILDPDSGEAWVMGKNTQNEGEAIKENIGYMSQRFGLYADLTVMENLNFFADIYSVSGKERATRTERLLAFSKLEPFKKRLAKNLSGGMKQKLGLMCALIHTPKILFLDEPTNGVDPLSRRDFWQILYQLLKEKVTIFFSTAYLDEAERCNRVGLIHQGKLLACDAPARIKQNVHGSVLEVRTDQNRLTNSILQNELNIKNANLFGSKIHAITPTPEETSQQIIDKLQSHGIHLQSLRPVTPSLEDAFISMLG